MSFTGFLYLKGLKGVNMTALPVTVSKDIYNSLYNDWYAGNKKALIFPNVVNGAERGASPQWQAEPIKTADGTTVMHVGNLFFYPDGRITNVAPAGASVVMYNDEIDDELIVAEKSIKRSVKK